MVTYQLANDLIARKALGGILKIFGMGMPELIIIAVMVLLVIL